MLTLTLLFSCLSSDFCGRAFADEPFLFDFKQVPLEDILNYYSTQYDVEFFGLDPKLDDKITFVYHGADLESSIKRLLLVLNESNYALEYSESQVRYVSVFPTAKGDIPSFKVNVSQLQQQSIIERVVKIIDIVEGSQAQTQGLEKGDIIVSYDGHRIRSSQELVEHVKDLSFKDNIEMMVIKKGEPMMIQLKGGFIGVGIRTDSMLKSEFENYERSFYWKSTPPD